MRAAGSTDTTCDVEVCCSEAKKLGFSGGGPDSLAHPLRTIKAGKPTAGI
jgi:hypothetical protein